MSRWIIKAIVQKGISYLPASRRINYFFQKHVTGGVHLSDEHFGLKIGHASDHYGYMLNDSREIRERSILELGTGWYPVIPILFYLTGAGRVISVDIQQWMTRQTQQDTIFKYRQWKEKGLLNELAELIKPERWNLLMGVLDEPDKYSKDDINQLLGLLPWWQMPGNFPCKTNLWILSVPTTPLSTFPGKSSPASCWNLKG